MPTVDFISSLIPDPADARDWLYEWSGIPSAKLVDLRSFTPQIEDQQNTNSCTANAVINACEMFLQSKGRFADLSRLFNYWNSRQALWEPYKSTDQGSTVREALRSAKNQGLPLETLWPFNAGSVLTQPSQAAFDDGVNRALGAYRRIPKDGNAEKAIEHALASGYPVVIGAKIGQQLFNIGDGIYQAVNPTINREVGGHAMVIVGYDKTVVTERHFLVENSWGAQFGMAGFFKMAYAVAGLDCHDIWVIEGFGGINTCGVNQMYKTDPAKIIEAYHNVGRIDVNDTNDPNVQYWAKNISNVNDFYRTFIVIAGRYIDDGNYPILGKSLYQKIAGLFR